MARLAFALVFALIVYASLFPFTGWADVGIPAFAYVQAPWPRYWVGAEIATNVVAYAPLGALGVWALYPRVRGGLAILLAWGVGAGLSAGLEALQTFLPGRIASNVDLAANAAGALLGALFGAATARRLVGTGALAAWRMRNFAPHAGPVLILAAWWVVAQIPRQPMLFGTGELWMLLGSWTSLPADWLGVAWSPSPAQRLLAERWCTGIAVVAVSMLLLSATRPVPWRGLLPLLLIGVALALKAALHPVAVPGQAPGIWWTGGAASGLLVGLALSVPLAYMPAAWQRGVALAALLAQLAIVNLFPPDQYFDAATAFDRGGWLHLESLALGLSVLWPVCAGLWLARSGRRGGLDV